MKAAEVTERPHKNWYLTVDHTLQSGEENKELSMLSVDTVQSKATPGIHAKVKIDGEPLNMELDTGTSVTVVPTRTWKAKLKEKDLRSCNILYTGEPMKVLGEAQVMVNYQGQSAELPLVVVDVEGPPSLW